jgi:GNAT superfamily N-acetyltransferase
MSDIEIFGVTVPQRIDDPDAADFIRAIELGNAVEAIGYGTPDLAYEPAESLPWYHNPDEPQRMLGARLDGELVGRALYETTTGDDADTAWINVEVLSEFRGRGFGTALAEAVEQLAIADGKAKGIVFCPIRDEPGDRLHAPTGFGSVPAASRDARFLLARGYSLEQIERASRRALPVPGLDALVAGAIEAAGAEYAVRTWVGSTPEVWREDLALLATRMSTDAPTAGLEEPEDVWTAERIAETDARNAQMSPRQRLTVAIEHLPTAHLVAFSVLSVPRQRHRAVAQYATLVLREHRGHRLGMLMKVANLAQLEAVFPGHPSVTTFNAEENRHMLSVNEAVGFVAFAYESAWRKDLA